MKRKDLIEKLEKCNLDELSKETIGAMFKPEPEYVPEHLDFGLDKEGNTRIALKQAGKGPANTLAGVACIDLCSGNVHTKMGNLAELMKQWATDCEETKDFSAISVHFDGTWLRIGRLQFYPDDMVPLANFIKQLYYTQLRKEGK